MFKRFGLGRVAVELRRIANSLEIIALHFAKEDGRMWNPTKRQVIKVQEDEDEILHTMDHEMLVQELQDFEDFLSGNNPKHDA